VAVATAVETTTASVGKVAAAAVVMATVAMKAKAARGGMDDDKAARATTRLRFVL
jgi:hypothetical protein